MSWLHKRDVNHLKLNRMNLLFSPRYITFSLKKGREGVLFKLDSWWSNEPFEILDGSSAILVKALTFTVLGFWMLILCFKILMGGLYLRFVLSSKEPEFLGCNYEVFLNLVDIKAEERLLRENITKIYHYSILQTDTLLILYVCIDSMSLVTPYVKCSPK